MPTRHAHSVLTTIAVMLVTAHTSCGQDAAALDADRLSYTRPFFPEARYDAAIATPKQILGFDAGDRAALSTEIEQCLKRWAESSPRMKLVEYARSHENRALHYVVVTSPDNLARLEAIRQGMDRLANPEGLSDDEADKLIADLPAVAWLAYTIHGDETEGSDAALAVLYHLLADTTPQTLQLLDELVIIIDPVMNPDGRDRFVKMVAEHKGVLPDVDDQSLLHSGYWPRGRGNHYLFDLNRDWILAVHPETRGRIREVGRWNPLLFVDAHGMGSLDTHLFSPPRDPVNPNRPASRFRWAELFAQDQAAAFDRLGWLYYHGEWNEEWYPGYSDSWASYRGAVGILYEQASISADGVLRRGGRVLTYRESTHHHVVGSMTNLETLREHATARLRDFLAERRAAISPDGPFARRTFAILPTQNRTRWKKFLELMLLQGFTVHQSTEQITIPKARNTLGDELLGVSLPVGTLLIPNRQPLAHLLAVMLEFDTRLDDQSLHHEREEILKHGGSKIYDTTAWCLCMLYGLHAWEIPSDLPVPAPRITEVPPDVIENLNLDNAVAVVLDGASDASVAVAARCLEQQVRIRVARKEFSFEGQTWPRGSLVVTQLDNRTSWPAAGETTGRIATELGLHAVAVRSSLGIGDLPDLGGEHFTLLERPRIAMFGRGRISPYDYGSIWHLLDHQLGVPHTRIDEAASADLRPYNVLILPDRYGGSVLKRMRRPLEAWVRQGGTLIAIGASASDLARQDEGLSQVRVLEDVLSELDPYHLALQREWLAQHVHVPGGDRLWSHEVAEDDAYPWQADDKESNISAEELTRRDAWNRQFMPQGAILAARLDPESWLTAGEQNPLPVLIARQSLLMSGRGVDTMARFGVWSPAVQPRDPTVSADTNGSAHRFRRIGWSQVPVEIDVKLRMAGLLWPEAAGRLANAAYLTRESLGRGQVILFAAPPSFRGSTLATTRLLMNAMVFGPACGTSPEIIRHP